MATTPYRSDWVCFGGPHPVPADEGPNYCIDLHGSDRAVLIGPLCKGCFMAHREAAHHADAA